MVRVLDTLLCTYVQWRTMKNCRTVTASLVRKCAFLKEAVSENFNIILTLTFLCQICRANGNEGIGNGNGNRKRK